MDQPEHPGTEHPGTEHPGTEHPGTEHPGTEHPGTEHPGTEHPGTEHPGTEHPGTEHPGTEHPGTEHPGTEHPGTEHPGTEHPGTEHPAAERIWRSLPEDVRRSLQQTMPATDLQTLLLSVVRARAEAVSPARLLQRYADDAFSRPAPVDPGALAALEAELWRRLPTDVAGVALSPVTPLGTSAAITPLDQNRVVSTVRGSEVVSDPTNVLALEAACRRRAGEAQVHLAAHHRVLRGQRFGGGFRQHFTLFTLVSSGRDTGAARTQADFLRRHLAYWLEITRTIVPERQTRIAVSVFDQPALAERLTDTVRPALQARLDDRRELVDDPDRQRARGYYCEGALLINSDGVELGDGGFTDWTAQLLGDRKERCLISCLATERPLELS